VRWVDATAAGIVHAEAPAINAAVPLAAGPPPMTPSSPTLDGMMPPFSCMRCRQAPTYSKSHSLYFGSCGQEIGIEARVVVRQFAVIADNVVVSLK